MTNVLRAARDEARDTVRWVGRQLGVFLLVGFLLGNGLTAFSVYAGVEPSDVGLSASALFVPGILVTGAVAAWLEVGGFERLRADPSAASEFVALGLVQLPFSFLPAAYAASVLLGEPLGLQSVYAVGCVLAAAWASLYGGLDRIGVDADVFAWTPVYVLLGIVVAWLALLVAEIVQVGSGSSVQSAISLLRTDPGLVVVAVAGQSLACYLGVLHARRGESPLWFGRRGDSE